MEIWTLDHPELGRIEVRIGNDLDFLDIDPDWPGELPERLAKQPGTITRVPADGSLPARVKALRNKAPTRVQVLVDATVQHQYDSLESGRIPLYGKGPQPTLSPMVSLGVDRAKPHLKILANQFKEVLSIEFREGSTIVEFDPPAGSRGERRRNAMQSSDLKRTLIPMAEGLGKGGWALIILLLGPLVGRLLAWLEQFLPDWELPRFTLPHVDLPVPHLPQVELPLPRLPEIPFPDIPDMPYWVEWLAEYSKIWVPVVLGVVFGILALRNHRRSEAQKAEWRGDAQAAHPIHDAQDPHKT